MEETEEYSHEFEFVVGTDFDFADTSVDIIGYTGFGYDFQLGESEEAKVINTYWDRSIGMMLRPEGFIASVVLRTFPWLSQLPFRAPGDIKGVVRKAALKIIRDNKDGGEEVGGKDLLSVLIRMKEGGFDLDELLDQASAFLPLCSGR